MKIALFCNELPPRPSGGIGTVTLTLAAGLRDVGHQITLIEIGDEYFVSTNEIGIKCVTIKKSNLRYFGGLLTRINLWLFLQKSWLKNDFDIAEIPDFEGYVPFPSLLPIVVRLHNSTTLMCKRRGSQPPASIHLFEYLSLKFSRCWIGVSDFIINETENSYQILKKSKCTIYNPINKSKINKSVYSDEQIILFAGTLSESKGVLALSHALVTVFNANKSAKIVFAGKSTIFQGKPIEVAISKILHNHLNRVNFTGHIPHSEILALMAKASCFAFPSKFESFSLVVAEAMSVGLPVIFTKYAPGPELINNGKTGLLVDPENHYEIANAIKKIIDDPIFSERLAKAASQYCLEHFSLYKCVNETTKRYEVITQGLQA